MCVQCRHTLGARQLSPRLIRSNSYYKNVLALKLFVGRVRAYFQIHTLSQNPPIYQKLADDHLLLARLPKEELSRLSINY